MSTTQIQLKFTSKILKIKLKFSFSHLHNRGKKETHKQKGEQQKYTCKKCVNREIK